MVRTAARPPSRALVTLALLAFACAGLLSGCQAPAISKAQLDAGKLPSKHPKLTAQQKAKGCRGCHREQPAIRKK